MTGTMFLNGRFLTQPLTGVQRFALEMTRAIDGLTCRGDWPQMTVLVPRAGRSGLADGAAEGYRRLRLRVVGRTGGHLWEQTELPGATRGGILVNLGNTAPLLAGTRQVVVIHDAAVFDMPESYSPRFRAWYKTLQRALVMAGAKVATVSAFSRERIAARLGLDQAGISVIYEGADHILRVPTDPATLARHRLTPGRYALVVGSRVAHKNLAALHEAALALRGRGMTVAVAGAVNANVYREIRDLGFAGQRLSRVGDAELRALYENALCLLFPSRYEGFGLPPVEAMACGCPVLAPRGGAVEEVCSDGALYFSAADQGSVREAVERLLDEAALREQLRARGLARVAGLSWEASARALGDVVRTLQ